MILLSMLAAAAVPVEASKVVISDDMRCVTMFLVAAGSSKAEEQAGMVADALYFMGKSDGRSPDAELAPQTSALITSPDYFSKQLPADAERCTKEVETMSQRLDSVGKALDALSKAAAPAAKPEPSK
ncbi:hypothetical protein [Novosphingobium sp.]|uniref:hypothetical protein n=1 Tax=Novosphingobium sp. TaxID=1874826 RepID=UPI00260059EA|nr:hypothetical protein [Novosphingobium sp.]